MAKLELRVLMNRLPGYTATLPERVRMAVRTTAAAVETGAKRRAPVRTGALRNSILTHFERDGLEALVGTALHYAPYVEFGTRRMAPRPYLGPSAEAAREVFAAALREATEP